MYTDTAAFQTRRAAPSMQAAVTWDGFTLLRSKKNTCCQHIAAKTVLHVHCGIQSVSQGARSS